MTPPPADEQAAALKAIRDDLVECQDTIATLGREIHDAEDIDNPYWLLEIADAVLGEAIEILDHGNTPAHVHRLNLLSAIHEITRGEPDELMLDDMRATMAMLSGHEIW